MSKNEGKSEDETSSSMVYHFQVELPPIFHGDGSEDFGQWCRRLEVAVKASQFNKSGLDEILPIRLGGAAFNYWDSLADSIKSDYAKVKSMMNEIFRKQDFITTFQTYVNARPRRHNEPIEIFKADIVRLVNEAFPTYDTIAREGEAFRRFVAGLAPYLQLKIHEMGATDLLNAVSIATRVERAHLASRIQLPQNHNGENANITESKLCTLGTDEFNGLKESIDMLTKKVGKLEVEISEVKQYYRESCVGNGSRQKVPSPYTHEDSKFSTRYRSMSPYRNHGGPSNRGRDQRPYSNDFARDNPSTASREYYYRRSPSPNRQSQDRRERYRSPSPYRSRRFNPSTETREYYRRSPSPKSQDRIVKFNDTQPQGN